MMTQERTEWVSRLEAAQMAGVSESTVRYAINAGELKYKATLGQKKLLRREDVEAWIERRQRPQPIEGK